MRIHEYGVSVLVWNIKTEQNRTYSSYGGAEKASISGELKRCQTNIGYWNVKWTHGRTHLNKK